MNDRHQAIDERAIFEQARTVCQERIDVADEIEVLIRRMHPEAATPELLWKMKRVLVAYTTANRAMLSVMKAALDEAVVTAGKNRVLVDALELAAETIRELNGGPARAPESSDVWD